MARLSSAVLPLALVALAACGDAPGVVAPTAKSPEQAPSLSVVGAPTTAADGVVPGQYIVTFRSGVRGGAAKAAQVVAANNGQMKFAYARILNGFSAKLSDAAVRVLRLDPDIESVVPDQVVTLSTTETSAPWGLDRLDQAALPLSTTYTYTNDGTGVTVYIVDTGINTRHVDFGGRAVGGYDAITSGGTATDCHGHGTHVAGTVGGTKYGVAKGVRLVAVRVLDCTGSGTTSTVLAGLDYVAAQKAASPSTPMVMNMSLGGGASTELDNGVQNVINAGVVAAIAAGNSSTDACTTSPARVAAAITVGATDNTDTFASFSNRGTCVDIDAPGVNITSDYYSSNTATATMSGTSMATPHVAGVAALYLQANPAAAPAQVATALVGNAVNGVLKSVPASTVNKLLNMSFLSGPPPAPTVTVSPSTASLVIGGTAALTATVANPVSGGTVSWVSRDPSVATVASTGATTATATAAAPGSTYIVSVYTAGSTTVRDSAKVTVATPTIAVSPQTASLVVGGQAALTATIGNAAASGGSVTWTARNTAVATVASTGATTATATAAGVGSTYIVAAYTAGSTTVRDSVALTVTAPSPSPTYMQIVSAISTNPCASTKADPATVTSLVSNPCVAGATTQRFEVPAAGTSGPVRTAGGLCVAVAGAGAEGASVITAACNGTAAQNWTFDAAGEWRGGPADKCVGVFFGNTTPGTALVYYTCNGSTAKKWSVKPAS